MAHIGVEDGAGVGVSTACRGHSGPRLKEEGLGARV